MLPSLNSSCRVPKGIKYPDIILEQLDHLKWTMHPLTPWIQYKVYPHAIYELNMYRDFLTVYNPRNVKATRHVCIQLKDDFNSTTPTLPITNYSLLNPLLTKKEILTIARAATATYEMFPSTLGRQIADLLLYNRTGENLFITAHEGKGSFPLLALLLESTPRELATMRNFDFFRLMKDKIPTVKDFFNQLYKQGLEMEKAPATSQVTTYLPKKWSRIDYALDCNHRVELPTLADLFMWFPEISISEDDNESFVSIFIYRLEDW